MPLETLINAGFVDYLILLIYFVFVLGIGLAARHQVSDSLDFFLSGRSLPGWVTGLAFVSANLGAVEIMGMSANGARSASRRSITFGSALYPRWCSLASS
ncbi:sodium-dependent galactose transporter [Cutibacterium acnes JCM 18916]|nr:sodium-dependent galactose transporter [Cutibacterium acnes JCM 18916]GAE79412.1 sodium-dependent galactose transporter [Cutibacterium acnes JCM 18920]